MKGKRDNVFFLPTDNSDEEIDDDLSNSDSRNVGETSGKVVIHTLRG